MKGKRAFGYSCFLSKEEKTTGRQRTRRRGATIGDLWGERRERTGNIVKESRDRSQEKQIKAGSQTRKHIFKNQEETGRGKVESPALTKQT